MEVMWTIVSSCGTSLLTNGADDHLRKLLTAKSNVKWQALVSAEENKLIERRIKDVETNLQSADREDASRYSAELNAINKLYADRGRQWGNKKHLHWLICTDTWLGEASADLAKKWLERQGFVAQVHRQTDLQTETITEFQLALSDLTKWCYEHLPSPQQAHSKVIFNLTGGFKSVNGFLQTIGMFRADEVVYIFEGEKRLVSIPKLPVKLTSHETIRENLKDFRRLSLGLATTNINGIPETYLLKIGNDYSLSPWGGIEWNEFKSAIYSECLFDSPDHSVEISETVKEKALSYKHKYFEMNDQIDKLIKYLKSSMREHLNSLNFQVLKGDRERFEFKAWDDEKGFRFFGRKENGRYIIDDLDKGIGH